MKLTILCLCIKLIYFNTKEALYLMNYPILFRSVLPRLSFSFFAAPDQFPPVENLSLRVLPYLRHHRSLLQLLGHCESGHVPLSQAEQISRPSKRQSNQLEPRDRPPFLMSDHDGVPLRGCVGESANARDHQRYRVNAAKSHGELNEETHLLKGLLKRKPGEPSAEVAVRPSCFATE